jgi:hypothetical protein
MGLFSFLSKKKEPLVIPSKEEQEAMAMKSLNAFMGQMYDMWNDTDDEFRCEYFRIAGISYRCGRSDVGMIRGVTFKDKSNTHDKTAIGIDAVDDAGRQKLVGYISKDDKARYKKLVGDAELSPFIGYIRPFTDESGHSGVMGVIKVYAGEPTSKGAYAAMLKDTKLLMGVFRGYFKDQNLEEEGIKLEWVLDREF